MDITRTWTFTLYTLDDQSARETAWKWQKNLVRYGATTHSTIDFLWVIGLELNMWKVWTGNFIRGGNSIRWCAIVRIELLKVALSALDTLTGDKSMLIILDDGVHCFIALSNSALYALRGRLTQKLLHAQQATEGRGDAETRKHNNTLSNG